MVEIIAEEQNIVKKKLKRTERSLRDLWDNIKCHPEMKTQHNRRKLQTNYTDENRF